MPLTLYTPGVRCPGDQILAGTNVSRNKMLFFIRHHPLKLGWVDEKLCYFSTPFFCT